MERYCDKCQTYNCTKHGGLTQGLNNLLEFFQEPEETKTMRTFVDPEKNSKVRLPVRNNFDRHDSRVSSFSDDSLKSMAEDDDNTLYRVQESKAMPKSEPVTTTAMIHVGSSSTTTHSNSKKDEPIKFTGGKYRPHERHHFIKIHATSFVTCSSPGGQYSETALALWIDNKYYHKYPNEKYRVILSLMFDAEEDLWSISAKLFKRSYMKDEEEGNISNRLCVTSELRSEIKKMLLYLGLSPRDAYRMFRRNAEESFIINESEYGFVTVECESHSKLLKEWEKPSSYNYDCHGFGYGVHRGSHGIHRGREKDPLKHAMSGYDEYWGE